MTDQLYRIKLLKWKQTKPDERLVEGEAWRLSTIFGPYYVRFTTVAGWFWGAPHHNCQNPINFICGIGDYIAGSEEAAKEAAEQHYRERLMEALQPVDATKYRDMGDVRKAIEEFAQKGPSND